MTSLNTSRHYERVAQAIQYMKANFQQQPSLDEVAQAVNLSPYHFQRMFSEWAGTSPKSFLQYLSAEYAKKRLREKHPILDTAFETGFSSVSRLHDLFIQIEGMTPSEYQHGGKHLQMAHQFLPTPFGPILVAATDKGICHLVFVKDEAQALDHLRQQFPAANLQAQTHRHHATVLQVFSYIGNPSHKGKQNAVMPSIPIVRLHIKGTPFQLKVWQALLKIPSRCVSSYGQLSQAIHHPQASRAVGTAIGANPIAYLIPCHRVILSTGKVGAYRWGEERKEILLAWEAAQGEQYDNINAE